MMIGAKKDIMLAVSPSFLPISSDRELPRLLFGLFR